MAHRALAAHRNDDGANGFKCQKRSSFFQWRVVIKKTTRAGPEGASEQQYRGMPNASMQWLQRTQGQGWAGRVKARAGKVGPNLCMQLEP